MESGIGTNMGSGMTRHQRWYCAMVTVALVGGVAGCTAIREHGAKTRVTRGEALLEEQDLEAALAEFQAAAQLAPQLASPHSRMGAIFQRMGDYEKAISAFLEAIRRNPFSFDDTFDLARLYQFTHRVKDAILAYLHVNICRVILSQTYQHF